eukprot:3758625-Rhodomonas_salina.1
MLRLQQQEVTNLCRDRVKPVSLPVRVETLSHPDVIACSYNPVLELEDKVVNSRARSRMQLCHRQIRGSPMVQEKQRFPGTRVHTSIIGELI